MDGFVSVWVTFELLSLGQDGWIGGLVVYYHRFE